MRVVRSPDELAEATAAARREARRRSATTRCSSSAASSARRHIEVQVLADAHGTSSAPRRARVLAAAPPPEGDRGGPVAASAPALRARMGAAAVALARACGYVGAGHGRVRRPRPSGERILLPRDEHAPAGRAPRDRGWSTASTSSSGSCASPPASARLARRTLVPSGHAIEARVYAEDPADGFLPATGSACSATGELARARRASTPAIARGRRASARAMTRLLGRR